MNDVSLDAVDHGILYSLQRNARNITIAEIADQIEVSASTVRNRIEKLEECGVIEGYYPKINYERANFPLHVLFVCNAPPEKREELAATTLEVRGVIDVREMLTSMRNLYVEVVATDTRNLTAITNELTSHDLEVTSSEIITSHRVKPWAEFEFQPEKEPEE